MASLELENQRLRERDQLRRVPALVTSLSLGTPQNNPAAPQLPRLTPSIGPKKEASELAVVTYALLNEFDTAIQMLGNEATVVEDDKLLEVSELVGRNCSILEDHIVNDVRNEVCFLLFIALAECGLLTCSPPLGCFRLHS